MSDRAGSEASGDDSDDEFYDASDMFGIGGDGDDEEEDVYVSSRIDESGNGPNVGDDGGRGDDGVEEDVWSITPEFIRGLLQDDDEELLLTRLKELSAKDVLRRTAVGPDVIDEELAEKCKAHMKAVAR